MNNGRPISFMPESKSLQSKEASAPTEKKAGESALDKATAIASKAGRPTSTGLAAGAGLGTILAAIGAVNKSNNPESGIISNPLLLGALGAAAGYAGGNMFDSSIKTKKEIGMKAPLLTTLLGAYGLGTGLSKYDTVSDYLESRKDFEDFIAKPGTIVETDVTDKNGNPKKDKHGNPIKKKTLSTVPSVERKYNQLKQENIKAMLRDPTYTINDINAKHNNAFTEGNTPSKLRRWFTSNEFSPLKAVRSLNPFKSVLNEQTLHDIAAGNPVANKVKMNRLQAIERLLNRATMSRRIRSYGALGLAGIGAGWGGINAIRKMTQED